MKGIFLFNLTGGQIFVHSCVQEGGMLGFWHAYLTTLIFLTPAFYKYLLAVSLDGFFLFLSVYKICCSF